MSGTTDEASGEPAADDEPADGGAAAKLRRLPAERPVIVCCGSGGVGKTTIAATFALQAARAGRRACVVTVDPARRLADALGVDTLANEPSPIEGPGPGTLCAVMLDTKGTFDELVRRYARGPEQAAAIQSNRIYQNLTGALSGTQEYMAMEKLYELTESGDYDVVVVDTPPTRNALDLLDAPRRLTHFLEHRLFRALLLPTRAYLRAVSVATRALLRTIGKVAGSEIVQDAVTFFQAFEGMEEGFRVRADAVRSLLNEPSTAYVLVTSPRPDAVDEATYFAAKLSETGIAVAGLVVNRAHPMFGAAAGPPALPGASDNGSTPDGRPATDAGAGRALQVLEENLADLNLIARREAAVYTDLSGRVDPAPVGLVPLLGTDVHDLGGVAAVADHLFGQTGSAGADSPPR